MHPYFPFLMHSYFPKIEHICFLVTLEILKSSEEHQNSLIQKDQENTKLMLTTVGSLIITRECLQWRQEQVKQSLRLIAC